MTYADAEAVEVFGCRVLFVVREKGEAGEGGLVVVDLAFDTGELSSGSVGEINRSAV